MNPEVTHDALFGGRLELLQPARGYRVNVDSLILAAFALRGRRAEHALDLGAGSGVLALALHLAGGAARLSLVERSPELVELARRNLESAGSDGVVHQVTLGVGRLPRALAQSADLVVSNPPFFDATGRRRSERTAPSDPARSGALAPFVVAAARALRGPRGRACFAYPAASLAELLAVARGERLVAKRLRFVHARAGEPARLALLELRVARSGGLVVEAPLIEWVGRARSAELLAIVEGRLLQRDSRRAR